MSPDRETIKEPARPPIRTCMGCMEPDQKAKLVRIAAGGAKVEVDWSRLMPGRAGYLHPRRDCLERFVNTKVKQFRSLRLTIDRQNRSTIADAIQHRLERASEVE